VDRQPPAVRQFDIGQKSFVAAEQGGGLQEVVE
jgi:hypothetical protein